MPQFFKGDALEQKFYNAGKDICDQLSLERDEFFEDAFNCFILGEVLYDTKRSPLVNAIPRDIFRESFSALFNSFVYAGSFESYLDVFKKIFGDEVLVTFAVPNPGHLQINITTDNVILFDAVARRIENNQYIFDNLITQDGDQIVFQTIKGFQSEYELKQMLFEMVPDGIHCEITLTIA